MGPDFRGHNGRKSAVDRGAAGYHAFALERSEISVTKAAQQRRFRVCAPQYLATEAVALQFESKRMTASDTIAAISTPPGEGAIALVRISGANAIRIADKIFQGKEQASKFTSHVQHLGEIFSTEDQLID